MRAGSYRAKSKKAASLALAVVLGGSAFAGPITSNNALPIHDGQWIVRAQAKAIRSTEDRSLLDRDLRVVALPAVIVHGWNERLAFFGIIPYLDKKLELTTPQGRLTRGDAGLGDIRLFGRYTLSQWDKPGETLRLAPFAGVEVPTGRDNAGDVLGRLPRPLQLGSGSWDPFAGLVFSWQTLQWEFDASISYEINTPANDFEFGEAARFDASFQYRLIPRVLDRGVPGFLYGVLETTWQWNGRNTEGEQTDPDSGGTAWYLTPGIQYVTKRFILEAAVQIPVVQNLNGMALENDYTVTAGFRITF